MILCPGALMCGCHHMTARRQERQREGKMASHAPSDLVTKKNTTSAVWHYCGFRPNEKGEAANTDGAICKLCDKKVTARDGNTSNLRTHLWINHLLTAAKMHLAPSSLSASVSTPHADTAAGPTTSRSTASYTQPTIIGAFRKATKYKQDSVRRKTCTDAVTKYLAKEIVCFHTVEKKLFKDMVKVLDAQYELPGWKHFSQTAVPRLYNKVRDEVQVLLSEADSYSLTTDIWSSVNMTPYMSRTVHTIRPTPEWKLESKCLQTTYFPESYGGQSCCCTQIFTSGLAAWQEKTFSHNHWQHCQHFCCNQVAELAVAQLLRSQSKLGCHKCIPWPEAKKTSAPSDCAIILSGPFHTAGNVSVNSTRSKWNWDSQNIVSLRWAYICIWISESVKVRWSN